MRELKQHPSRLVSLLAEGQGPTRSQRQSALNRDQSVAACQGFRHPCQSLPTSADDVSASLAVGHVRAFCEAPDRSARRLRPCPPSVAEPPALGGDARNLLLVVEDDPDDFMLLERALRKSGEQAILHWVQTAREALTSLATLETDAQIVCVVADVQLPGIDGFELLRLVKSRPSPARLRFAFLTGRRDAMTRERARESGADAFFIKPTGHSELIEIARALARLAAATAD